MLGDTVTEETTTEETTTEETGVIPAEETGTIETAAVPEVAAPEEWYLREGIKGEGDRPDYFDAKYKTVEEQAKGYKELVSKLGAFTGAPEGGYKLQISDAAKEAGFNIETDDPLFSLATDFAKEKQMNQEGFDDMVDVYAQIRTAEAKLQEEYVADQVKELGPRGQERIDDLKKWGAGALAEDMQEGFQSLFSSAANIEVGEQLVAMLLEKGTNPGAGLDVDGHTEADVQAMQFEKDENGNQRIRTDPEFRKKYEELSNKVRGTHEARQMIG